VPLAGSILGKKIISKTTEKLADAITDDVARLYAFVRAAAAGMMRYAIPKSRPVSYVIKICEEPNVELLARTDNPDELIRALAPETVQDTVATAMRLRDTLRAVRVQFLLTPEGRWVLNYLLTNTGGVIGRPASFIRQRRRLELMRGDTSLTGTVELDHE
jgi:hypothetical protein